MSARPRDAMPTVARERGERALLVVLRRRHEGALFLIRDRERERAVGPENTHAPREVAGGAAADLDAAEVSGEHGPPVDGLEARPHVGDASPDR